MRFVLVGTAHCEIGEAFESHLLGVRRSSDACQTAYRNVVDVVEKLRASKVVVGDKTLYGCDYELVAQAGLEFLEMILQIR